MRRLRPEMASTVDLLSFYDCRNKLRDVQALTEMAETRVGLSYPISGDDLALATYEGEPK